MHVSVKICKTKEDTMRALLLSYIGLLAERNGFAPSELFEYKLWDALRRVPIRSRLVSRDEANEILWLTVNLDCWVTYNEQTGMFQVIDIETWHELLAKRDH